MNQEVQQLCNDIADFVTDNEILNAMIKATAKDGKERGAEIQVHQKGENYSIGIGNMCTGNECEVRVPYSEKRIASFHTHPGVHNLAEADPLDIFSMADLFTAIWYEEITFCVGQMYKNEKGEFPKVTCACIDVEPYKQRLFKELTR